MGALKLPLHSYTMSSRAAGIERLVNCYAEAQPAEGKGPTSIVRSSGIVPAVTYAGGGRGLYRFKDKLHAVAGRALYRIDADHSSTLIGTILGSQLCTFADNTTQLVVCDPSITYVYDLATLAQITDPDFNHGIACGSINSFIVFLGLNGEFFCSDLAAATSFDALNFATAEGSPDLTIGILIDHEQVLLFGTDTLELWNPIDGTGFPFGRASNGLIEMGCAAGRSVCKLDNAPHWLGNDRTLRRLDGSTGLRVSQHGFESAVQNYARVDDAVSFAYSERGHMFMVITFPTAGHTWVLDATTREMHERESYGLTRWRPCATALAYGRNYVQDFQTGSVAYLDAQTYTDWDGPQRMVWTYPSVYDKGDLLFHSSLSVRVDVGKGTVTGQGVNPQIQLECSDNGGQIFEHVEDMPLGIQGQFDTRVEWNQLGMADDRVYRNSVSDPVPITVSDAQLVLS